MTDSQFWHPYIAAICARHRLPCTEIQPGLPGTNIVFVVNGRFVVKLYPELFGGARSYPTEQACYQLIAEAGTIPAPALIASGMLFDAEGGWHWPYLITTRMPGASVSESTLEPSEHLILACWIAGVMRRIHSLPLPAGGPLKPDWSDFLAFLQAQRAQVSAQHRRWGTLPGHLIEQLEEYLPPADLIVHHEQSPVLIHGDLNSDHVLGVGAEERWRSTGVIDFGDARVGDPAYDLVALHLGLFGGDTALLRIFLEAYQSPVLSSAIPQRTMCMTLLHEFNVLDGMGDRLVSFPTLEALADWLWGVS